MIGSPQVMRAACSRMNGAITSYPAVRKTPPQAAIASCPRPVNAARDFARFIQAGNFGVKGPRQQHGLVSLDGAFLQVRLCSVAMCHPIILYAAWGNAMPFHETSGDFMPAGLNGRSGCTAGRQGRGRGTPVPERRFLHPLHPLPVPEKIPRFTSLPAEGSISVRIWDAPHRSLRKTIPFP